MTLTAGDRFALGAIEATLRHARDTNDQRPPLQLLAHSLAELGTPTTAGDRYQARVLATDRGVWLARVRAGQRSQSTLSAYRLAIDDLLAWVTQQHHTVIDEQAIVEYLDDYRQRCRPAPATYYRRFVLLRRFLGWSCRRHGAADPFLELAAPVKPRHAGVWLTRQEFTLLLAGAERPQRNRPGLIERDRLVLLALAFTALRRSELIAVRWSHLSLDAKHPSLLVVRAKRGRPRRQPLPAQLAAELTRWQAIRQPALEAPVFCGLAGGPLQPAALARIISRAALRGGLQKHVTAHTLRHTSATWLRQAGADARLVAEYLGHADLTTVTRYAHVASEEMHDAAQTLADSSYATLAHPADTARLL